MEEKKLFKVTLKCEYTNGRENKAQNYIVDEWDVAKEIKRQHVECEMGRGATKLSETAENTYLLRTLRGGTRCAITISVIELRGAKRIFRVEEKRAATIIDAVDERDAREMFDDSKCSYDTETSVSCCGISYTE